MNATGRSLPPGCLTEEQIEAYLLGQASEDEADRIAGHLLFCVRCQDRAEELEGYIDTMRAALTNRQVGASKSIWRGWRAWGAAGAFAAAAALCTVFLLPRAANSEAEKAVVLIAQRGAAESAPPRAGQALLLTASTEGLPAAESFRMTIVDIQGREVALTKLTPRGGNLVWRLTSGLPAGGYWVRVQDASTGELLQEFGLQVR